MEEQQKQHADRQHDDCVCTRTPVHGWGGGCIKESACAFTFIELAS